MSEKLRRKSGIGLALILGLLLSTGLYAQKVRLIVIEEGAVVQVKPDAGSDVIQDVPLGALLEAEQKVGEWYEVKVTSRLGVSLTGYIHERFIRTDEVPVTITQTPPEASPPREVRQAGIKKGDIAVAVGYVSASFMNEKSTYTESWSDGLLVGVSERGEIAHKLEKKPYGLGFSFSYLIAGGLGIQLRLDYNFTAKLEAVEGGSTYKMTWSWEDGRGPFDLTDAWNVSGELSVYPISANLIYKLQSGGSLVPYFSGGVSYFLGSVKASSTRGVGITWEAEGSQFLDYLDVPVKIDESIGHIGFNLGAGLDFLFSPGFGVNLDAAYFVGKSIEQAWQHSAGTYYGNNFTDKSWTLDQENIELLNGQISPLDVNTSFFKIQAGIKVLF